MAHSPSSRPASELGSEVLYLLLQGTLIGAGLIALIFIGTAILAALVLVKYLYANWSKRKRASLAEGPFSERPAEPPETRT